MRLTEMVACAGCASKLGPGQLTEVLAQIPASADPNLLVGFDTRDDAGVYLLPDGQALVQTVDFFTPIVDDPYFYGAIAAANAMSDVYAMGGEPLTVLNVACFSPAIAPPEVWANILKGAYDKVTEAGAVVVGGHSVDDEQPKFGMAVTGIVQPERIFSNKNAKAGDKIWLTKPLGTGLITTAAKRQKASQETIQAAITQMATLNKSAKDRAQAVDCKCATDITGFSLAGHLYNIARASGVTINLNADSLPLLPDVQTLAEAGMSPGGATRNRDFLGENLIIGEGIPEWMEWLVVDPQTSGGLAICTPHDIPDAWLIGEITDGLAQIRVR